VLLAQLVFATPASTAIPDSPLQTGCMRPQTARERFLGRYAGPFEGAETAGLRATGAFWTRSLAHPHSVWYNYDAT